MVVGGAGLDMYELTNHRRVDIHEVGLKETGAKTERFRQKGNTVLQAGHMRKRICFLSTKACEPILIATQNKIT